MSAGSLCRVCLAQTQSIWFPAGNIKMYCIEKIGLKEIYEKVTSTKLNPGDGRPVAICYICRSQLQRCVKFLELSRRAEKTLTDLVNNGIQLTQQILIMLNLGMIKNLQVTTTEFLSLDSNYQSTEVAVKEEIIEVAETKIEIEVGGVVCTAVCRVCLAGNVRAHGIETIGLQEIFEKVTSTKLVTCDGRPVTICYICRSQLQRCHKFSEMSRRAEKMLADFSISSEMAQKSAPKLNIELVHNLSVTATQFMSSNDCSVTKSTPVVVKEEFNEDSNNTIKKCNVKTEANSYYTCHLCSKNYKTQLNLVRHLQNHPTDKVFACNHCKETFTSKLILKTHMEIHTLKFSCGDCNQVFDRKCNLERHLRIHTGARSFACNECNKTFNQHRGLQRHMTSHTGVSLSYACDQCKKTFYDKYQLQKHLIRHTGVKQFTCDSCNKGYYDRHNLVIHLRTHTGKRPFACNRCGKKFCDKSNMLKHMKIHTGLKPFACNQCSLTFSRNFVLKAHMRLHTGVRPYACSICLKSYTSKGNLTKHMVTHTKSYRCSICDNSFSSEFVLKLHVKNHTKEEANTCKTCNKTYCNNTTLIRHMRIHTKEKPHVCDQCDKAFCDPSNLHRHKMIHTGERPHACTFCSNTYSRAVYLRRHMKHHAKEIIHDACQK